MVNNIRNPTFLDKKRNISDKATKRLADMHSVAKRNSAKTTRTFINKFLKRNQDLLKYGLLFNHCIRAMNNIQNNNMNSPDKQQLLSLFGVILLLRNNEAGFLKLQHHIVYTMNDLALLLNKSLQTADLNGTSYAKFMRIHKSLIKDINRYFKLLSDGDKTLLLNIKHTSKNLNKKLAERIASKLSKLYHMLHLSKVMKSADRRLSNNMLMDYKFHPWFLTKHTYSIKKKAKESDRRFVVNKLLRIIDNAKRERARSILYNVVKNDVKSLLNYIDKNNSRILEYCNMRFDKHTFSIVGSNISLPHKLFFTSNRRPKKKDRCVYDTLDDFEDEDFEEDDFEEEDEDSEA